MGKGFDMRSVHDMGGRLEKLFSRISLDPSARVVSAPLPLWHFKNCFPDNFLDSFCPFGQGGIIENCITAIRYQHAGSIQHEHPVRDFLGDSSI